jgi:hypothetical protein
VRSLSANPASGRFVLRACIVLRFFRVRYLGSSRCAAGPTSLPPSVERASANAPRRGADSEAGWIPSDLASELKRTTTAQRRATSASRSTGCDGGTSTKRHWHVVRRDCILKQFFLSATEHHASQLRSPSVGGGISTEDAQALSRPEDERRSHDHP